MTYAAKSPQSGLYMEGNAGGFFAPEMSFAGYDMIIFEGISRKPVYLSIYDENVKLEDAGHLWGKTTSETYKEIVKDFGDPDVQVRSIGPAGENLVNPSVIIGNLHRSGGRSVGTVMGSKRLKAVAIRGTGKIELADSRSFEDALSEIFDELDLEKSIDPFTKQWGIYGSSPVTRLKNEQGALGTYNAQRTVFKDIHCIDEKVFKKYIVKPKACFCCPIPACSHWMIVNEGPFSGLELEGIQAGSLEAFGAMLGIKYFPAIAKAHLLCNELGLDMFIGVTIAWAYECYEKGIIGKQDTDGLELRWGNYEALLELIRKIARREGFGNLLAEGLGKAAEKIGKGSEKFALQTKGMEWEIIEPRSLMTHALALAVNDVGADHTRDYPPYAPSLAAVPKEIVKELGFNIERASGRLSIEEKGPCVKWLFDSRAVLDSLEFCVFLSRGRLFTDFRPFAKALTSVTGVQYNWKDMLLIGERICNLERAFNVREGMSRKDDVLPERFLKEPAEEGSRGSVVQLEPMLDDYYKSRGWSVKTGIPQRRKLEEMGLKYVADELENMGKFSQEA
jgi:aldehyde:ferredoxin oxidoreductase